MNGGRAALGRRWEDAAAQFLEARGLTVIARSYRCRLGELDLVCVDADALVIVEVRARSSGALVTASESVGRAKQQRLINATRHFLMRHPRYASAPLRFDVIAVDNANTTEAALDWIRNAFQSG